MENSTKTATLQAIRITVSAVMVLAILCLAVWNMPTKAGWPQCSPTGAGCEICGPWSVAPLEDDPCWLVANVRSTYFRGLPCSTDLDCAQRFGPYDGPGY